MVTHAGINNGGWLGVDVFFGLSGFLISSLLLVDVTKPKALRTFVGRRIRRLLPAFLAMVMAVAGLLMLGVANPLTQTDDALTEAWWSVLYVGNWYSVLSGATYWAEFSLSPFGHLWSLSIEEQFYVLFPATMVLIRRWPLRNRAWLLGGLAAASGIWTALAATWFGSSRVYYGTDTRAVSLLTGAFAAVLIAQPSVRRWLDRHRGIVGALGMAAMAALVAGAVLTDGSSPSLGLGIIQAASVSEAVVLVSMVVAATPLTRMLAASPMVWVGRRSYSLYLWHLPVFVLLPAEWSPWLTFAVGSPISMVLAHLSFELVENPFRLGSPRSRRARSMAIAAAFALCAAGLPAGASIEARPEHVIVATDSDPVPVAGTDLTDPDAPPPPAPSYPTVETLMVLGDSIALTFVETVSIEGLDLINNALLGCPTLEMDAGQLDGIWEIRPQHCIDWRDELWVERLEPADATLWMWGAWDLTDAKVGGDILRIGSPEYAAFLEAQLEAASMELTADGRQLFITAALCFEDGRVTELYRRATQQNEIIEAFARRTPDVIYLPLDDYLCDGPDQIRIAGVDPRPDGIHFSSETSKLIWEWVLPYVRGQRRPIGDT